MVKINATESRVGFAIVRMLDGTYVCPGWYEVPEGTQREDIVFTGKPLPKREEPKVEESTESLSFDVDGSRGSVYKVTRIKDQWDCSCPARQFRRGDCKHIKLKKDAV